MMVVLRLEYGGSRQDPGIIPRLCNQLQPNR
jgi:hypothetical protein